jgi:hypothetical protein
MDETTKTINWPDDADPNTPRTANQNLIAWQADRPEHVKPLAKRFAANCRQAALEGGEIVLRHAVDADTGKAWKRVNLHPDGSFECYEVTDPPPEAVPAFVGSPVHASGGQVEVVPGFGHEIRSTLSQATRADAEQVDPIVEPEPVVRKTTRK